MAETTNIEWADATFNPWIGCTAVSAACDHCYAEAWAKRHGRAKWGAHEPRERTAMSTWNEPRKWNRDAVAFETEHKRPRFVFCASLSDVFDNAVPDEWREDLWDLIRETPRLVWLLLTKRPQNIAKMLPADWGDGWEHVWLGTTVESQEVADRNIPPLMAVPAHKRFLSCEPLLGPLDVSDWLYRGGSNLVEDPLAAALVMQGLEDGSAWLRPSLDWVIAGGESGPGARPSHPAWFVELAIACEHAGVPFMFKQWGDWSPDPAAAVFLSEMKVITLDGRVGGAEGWDASPVVHPAVITGTVNIRHSEAMWKVGKKRAGRELLGMVHNGRPEAFLSFGELPY